VHGHREQVAQRAEVRFSGDGVTGDGGNREWKEQRQLQGQRGQRHEQPVVGDRGEEVRSFTAAARAGHLHRDGDQNGHRHQDEQTRLVAATAEDQPQLGAQEPRGCGTTGGEPGHRLSH
jgi:hypothetical protein